MPVFKRGIQPFALIDGPKDIRKYGPVELLEGIGKALGMATGVVGIRADAGVHQAGVAHQAFVGFVAVAQVQGVGVFAVPTGAGVRTGQLEAKRVLLPRTHLADGHATPATTGKAEQQHPCVFGVDGHWRTGPLGVRAAGEGVATTDWFVSSRVNGLQVGEHRFHFPTGDELHGVEPVGADVRHTAECPAFGSNHAPVVVGGV